MTATVALSCKSSQHDFTTTESVSPDGFSIGCSSQSQNGETNSIWRPISCRKSWATPYMRASSFRLRNGGSWLVSVSSIDWNSSWLMSEEIFSSLYAINLTEVKP